MSISNKVKSFFQGVMKPSPAAVSVAVSQAIKTCKPHTPLIKFRKGSLDGTAHAGAGHHGHSSSPAAVAATSRFPSAPSTPLKPNQSMQLPTIEDWQLPLRFRRRPLDIEEIEYINRGGPELSPSVKGKK